jgi:hypothetical protein
MACKRLYGEERADNPRTSEARIELPPPESLHHLITIFRHFKLGIINLNTN